MSRNPMPMRSPIAVVGAHAPRAAEQQIVRLLDAQRPHRRLEGQRHRARDVRRGHAGTRHARAQRRVLPVFALRRARRQHAYARRAEIRLEPTVTCRTHAGEGADAVSGIVRIVGADSNGASTVADGPGGRCGVGILGAEMRLALRATHLALDPRVVVAVDDVHAAQRHGPFAGGRGLVQVDGDVVIERVRFLGAGDRDCRSPCRRTGV